ncbi:hypothetical protein [Zavarzinia aquatilis]|uniref:Alpha/beta hydrolase n=1 Tax=Zavarzinia aquatilis TaxID=2211142 RepID=A0A317EIG8_9PROT|nr:hypothetical protein [Zavarzinia aquatilis]PWR25035.1 hypothetical protein DKG74_04510 [Zavarzinia aquatilis]
MTTSQAASADRSIRRRRVLFVSGFDPRGARHYHELWRGEAPKAAASAGDRVEYGIGSRKSAGPHLVEWTMTGKAGIDGQTVETETRFGFLRWDDVAREMWPKADWSFVTETFRTVVWATWAGYFRRIYQVRPVYMLTILQPVAVLCLLLLGLPLIACALLAAIVAFSPLPGFAILAGIPLGLLGVPRALAFLGRTGSVLWRGQLVNFYFRQIHHKAAPLDARMDQMADLIADAAAKGDCDEFLVIGHSVGTTVAISALGRALMRRRADFAGLSRVGFVTLGAMTPLLAAEPRCGWFRDEVAAIGLDPAVTWVDACAGADVVCFPLVDPLTLAGHSRKEGDRVSPLLTSPQFHKLFDPDRYAPLKRDRGMMHTLYLMATQRQGRCDFFALCAGPLALADRFPDTAPRKRR